MRVHEAAKQLGVTPRTLRFYEEKGLIHPTKTPENKYRSYSEEDLIKLRWIISLRELDMPLSSVHETISRINETDIFIRTIDRTRSNLYEQWLTATKALQALDETISDWQRTRTPDLVQLEHAATEMKRNRMLRTSWSDQWNYDEMAILHGYDTPLAVLNGMLEEEHYYQSLVRTVEWLDPYKYENGLELASGSGNLSSLLVQAGANLTVVEQSAEMLAIIRERLPSIDAKQGNMLGLPFATQSFSFIACTFAMHHLDPAQQLLALEEMDRVLLNGGRIAICDRITNHGGDSKRQLQWFRQNGYTTVTEQLNSSAQLVFASKP
ncbi:MerR family transcriptional regulator [Paenibacillus sinopodophylli]|uniref:MerR family transcriptional regulator n=1 Tax=Paenibacillus sinopodophylli TaxID=1837342 RepID=UPI00110CB8F5|nr:MerR family transcriptional regulator [Paenibacillus sinopodophylli]